MLFAVLSSEMLKIIEDQPCPECIKGGSTCVSNVSAWSLMAICFRRTLGCVGRCWRCWKNRFKSFDSCEFIIQCLLSILPLFILIPVGAWAFERMSSIGRGDTGPLMHGHGFELANKVTTNLIVFERWCSKHHFLLVKDFERFKPYVRAAIPS